MEESSFTIPSFDVTTDRTNRTNATKVNLNSKRSTTNHVTFDENNLTRSISVDSCSSLSSDDYDLELRSRRKSMVTLKEEADNGESQDDEFSYISAAVSRYGLSGRSSLTKMHTRINGSVEEATIENPTVVRLEESFNRVMKPCNVKLPSRKPHAAVGCRRVPVGNEDFGGGNPIG